MRKWSVNAIKSEETYGKEPVKGRRKMVAWDESYPTKLFDPKLDA